MASAVTIFASFFFFYFFSNRLHILSTRSEELPCRYNHVTGVLLTYKVICKLIGSKIIVSDTGNPFSTGYAGMAADNVFVSSINASNSIPHILTGFNFFFAMLTPSHMPMPLPSGSSRRSPTFS